MATTTFKGARYITKFADPIAWTAERSYEAIEAVQHNGFTYISKQPVPAGVSLDNDAFWLLWADPNAQMEQLRQLVNQYVNNVEELSSVVGDLNQELATEIEARKLDIEKAHVFETVADMEASQNLSVGAICHTNGFHASGDGGAAWYKISDSGTANEMDVIACGELFANLIVGHTLYLEQMGCVENTDITLILSKALTYEVPIDGSNKTYKVLSPVTAPNNVNLSNVKIDFNRVCTGLFSRSDATDYKAPLNVLMETAIFKNCEFFNAIDSNNAGTLSFSAALPITAKIVNIADCKFYDNTCNGVMLYGENPLAFEHVYINNCLAYHNGIYVDDIRSKTAMGIGSYQDVNENNTDIVIENCYCYDNANSGIGFHGLNNIKITDCKCVDNHEHGITVQSALNAIISNCISLKNNIRQIRIQGDWNVSPTYCKNVIVENCILNGERTFGIGGGCENIKINNCDITTNSVITFDPMGIWDKNVTVTGCNIKFITASLFDKKPTLFNSMTANELNCISYNNIIDNVIQPISGSVLNVVDINEPSQMFATFLPYVYGLTEKSDTFSGSSTVTVNDNEYTTSAGSGYLYNDVNIDEVNSFVALYVEGEYISINNPSEVRNGIMIQARGDDIIDFSNRLLRQTCNVVNTECKYCMIIDKAEFKKYYPNSQLIRFRFIVSNSINTTFKLNKWSVLY